MKINLLQKVKALAHWILTFRFRRRLSRYSRIVVSGCQRSGTTAVSQMIAEDLGYRNIDEHEFNTHDFGRFTEKLLLNNVVIQCPALSQDLHRITSEKTLVIWMVRPFEEIRESMKRINWDIDEEDGEKAKYQQFPGFQIEEPIEKTKFTTWNEFQKKRMQCDFIDLDYHGTYVKLHPFYLSKKYRGELKSKQTKI